MLKYVMK